MRAVSKGFKNGDFTFLVGLVEFCSGIDEGLKAGVVSRDAAPMRGGVAIEVSRVEVGEWCEEIDHVGLVFDAGARQGGGEFSARFRLWIGACGNANFCFFNVAKGGLCPKLFVFVGLVEGGDVSRKDLGIFPIKVAIIEVDFNVGIGVVRSHGYPINQKGEQRGGVESIVRKFRVRVKTCFNMGVG